MWRKEERWAPQQTGQIFIAHYHLSAGLFTPEFQMRGLKCTSMSQWSKTPSSTFSIGCCFCMCTVVLMDLVLAIEICHLEAQAIVSRVMRFKENLWLVASYRLKLNVRMKLMNISQSYCKPPVPHNPRVFLPESFRLKCWLSTSCRFKQVTAWHTRQSPNTLVPLKTWTRRNKTRLIPFVRYKRFLLRNPSHWRRLSISILSGKSTFLEPFPHADQQWTVKSPANL